MNQFPPYTLKRHPRSKHLRINIHADRRIVVTAPRHVPQHAIEQFVREKTPWITKTIAALPTSTQLHTREDITQESIHACRARATKYIRDRLVHFLGYYGYSYGRISIKKMTSRWGSCSSEGNLSFDYRLLFLPQEVSDYVIVHEICHLKELNHSSRFWQLVSETIPEYKKRKRELNRYIL